MRLGHELDLVTKIRFPGRSSLPKNSYKVIAGSYLSVNVIAGNVSAAKLEDIQVRLEQTRTVLNGNDQFKIDALTRGEIIGDVFHVGTLSYYAQLIALSRIAGIGQGAHHNLTAISPGSEQSVRGQSKVTLTPTSRDPDKSKLP